MGLQFALKRSGLAKSLREELFPDVQALLETNKNADNAADVLFGLQLSVSRTERHDSDLRGSNAAAPCQRERCNRD